MDDELLLSGLLVVITTSTSVTGGGHSRPFRAAGLLCVVAGVTLFAVALFAGKLADKPLFDVILAAAAVSTVLVAAWAVIDRDPSATRDDRAPRD